MKRTTRTIAVALSVVALLAGCAAQLASSSQPTLGERSGLYPPPLPGPYPPLPVARRLPIRWVSPRTAWRTVLVDRSERTPDGWLYLDMDGRRMAYARSTYSRQGGWEATRLMLRDAGGHVRVAQRSSHGRVFGCVRMSYPWLVWIDEHAFRETDWIIRAWNMRTGVKLVVARSDARIGRRQFEPTISLFGTLLAWDQRVVSRRGRANVIYAYDLAVRRRWVIDGPDGAHEPAVAGRTIYWNEETERAEGDRRRLITNLFAAEPGTRQKQMTYTGFARFCEAVPNLLVWTDARRYWAGQQALCDTYFRWRGGPTTRATSHGYVDITKAGKDLVAWVEFPGYICAVDLRTNRGFRLTGSRGRQAALCDVDGRRVAYQLSPSIWGSNPEGPPEFRVVELRR